MGVDVGHRLDGLLHFDHQVARRRCSATGHLARHDEQLVVIDTAVNETHPLGFGAVHHLAEHHTGERRLRADDAAQHPRVTAAGMDADLQEAGVESGSAGGKAQVAPEREVHTGADGRAVDRGDGGQRAAGDAQEPFVDGAEALLGGLGQVAEVGARAEGGRSTGDHHGAHRRIGLDAVHRRHDLGHQRGRERVALGGVVQRERRHLRPTSTLLGIGRREFDEDQRAGCIRHGSILSRPRRPRGMPAQFHLQPHHKL